MKHQIYLLMDHFGKEKYFIKQDYVKYSHLCLPLHS
ncbi:unnamed protein product [Paramecium primaurelia]|uniref:Uncharacterized protein n=1 Tax=Paramecium primaurelia TaxID=5886 RepID=A0A8S1M9N4_PARPR|nr:unnamed protein product [Paramecium primaurelia]